MHGIPCLYLLHDQVVLQTTQGVAKYLKSVLGDTVAREKVSSVVNYIFCVSAFYLLGCCHRL
jgi:hypothetical protein